MKAWVCEELSGESGLALKTLPEVPCGPGSVKIAAAYGSINYPDALIIRGLYQLKPDLPFTPGSEIAGTVIEVGDEIPHLQPGQRVLALPGVGAFMQEVLITPPFQQVHAIPDNMPLDEAAAFNMTYGTALHGLKQRAQLQAAETLLVLGAAGGCGSAAVEIGKAMGARVIAGASNETKCNLARDIGADDVINYSQEDLRDAVMALTGGQGVDVIFDPVGGELFKQAVRCSGWNSRYLVIGFAAGDIPQLGINYTILKSFALIGVAYGMSAIKDPAMNEANFQQLFRWYGEGKLQPAIGHRYRIEELPSALAEIYRGETLGKSVIALT